LKFVPTGAESNAELQMITLIEKRTPALQQTEYPLSRDHKKKFAPKFDAHAT